jgi:hypothetical protein
VVHVPPSEHSSLPAPLHSWTGKAPAQGGGMQTVVVRIEATVTRQQTAPESPQSAEEVHAGAGHAPATPLSPQPASATTA